METSMIEKRFIEIHKKLESIESKLDVETGKSKEIYLDNQELMKLLKISKRTAQEWRDSGIIPFSQIRNKLYYRLSDVEKVIENNLNNTLNRKAHG